MKSKVQKLPANSLFLRLLLLLLLLTAVGLSPGGSGYFTCVQDMKYFIYLFIYCNWVVTRWRWLLYM